MAPKPNSTTITRSIESSNTWETLGTTETVIATNIRGRSGATKKSERKPSHSPTCVSKSNYETLGKSSNFRDSDIGDDQYIEYSEFGEYGFDPIMMKARMKEAIANGEAETEEDALTSFFNFIFCIGNVKQTSEEERDSISFVRNGKNKQIRTESSFGSNTSDALILEQTKKETQDKESPRRLREIRKLDVVPEIQEQSQTSMGSERDLKNISSKTVITSNRNKAQPIPLTTSNSFLLKAQELGRTISKLGTLSGPKIGSFQNIASEEDALHREFIDTYNDYRISPSRGIDVILKQLQTSIPMHHQKHNDKMKLETSTSSVSTGSIMSSDTGKSKLSEEVKHVCSEPVSKIFDVRGPEYKTDGKKIPSDESMFALLGVDSIVKRKDDSNYRDSDVSKGPNSFFHRMKAVCEEAGYKTPFLVVVNFVVPWGNLLGYFYRPDGEDSGPFNSERSDINAEKLWKDFLKGDDEFRNKTLKFIPNLVEGPWALKKMVGTQPAMIGQKIPTTYFGSLEEGYLEINMNVTKGGKMANSICSAVASKASIVSIDLAFLMQGDGNDQLPEQILSIMRLHHVKLKKTEA